MATTNISTAPPEYNVTGIDYNQRSHLAYTGPIIDIHAHVLRTRPDDPANGPPKGIGPDASVAQAELMLEIGRAFGIRQTMTMCFPDDIPALRQRFGDELLYNGAISKKTID